MKNTIALIDKPKGITSFDVIRILRKKYGIRKMGHAGTLDPNATGLLIIGIGEGTKKLNEYKGLPKTYEAEILLGVKTTTGDIEGELIEEHDAFEIDALGVRDIVAGLVGKIKLPVPLYSAVKIAGKPLYRYARSGKTDIVLPKKEMEIFRAKLCKHRPEKNHHILTIEFEVSSGTYIRAIAEEIGRRLGLPATLKNLRRTKIGNFSVADADTILPR